MAVHDTRTVKITIKNTEAFKPEALAPFAEPSIYQDLERRFWSPVRTNWREEMNYTKGRWGIKGNRIYCDIDSDRARLIATIGGTDEEAEANAQLIATAPDMYEALKDIYEGVGKGQELIGSGRFDKMAKALEKAEGK